jgi:hypothetical protein
MAARPLPSPPLAKGRELELQYALLELYQFDKFLRPIDSAPPLGKGRLGGVWLVHKIVSKARAAP